MPARILIIAPTSVVRAGALSLETLGFRWLRFRMLALEFMGRLGIGIDSHCVLHVIAQSRNYLEGGDQDSRITIISPEPI
jgi:hypothetical protein